MLTHWIWLSRRKGIGHVGRKKLLSVVPTAEEIYDMTPEQYKSLGMKEMRSNWIETLSDKDLGEAEKIASDCDRFGIRCILYNDSDYPNRLKEIYDPPCVLYCKGTIPKVDEEATIGIVGTRQCSNFGLLNGKQLSSLIALSGGIVVSGGARGIDTIALNSALASIMPVICVLAGGLDEYYPAENRALFEAITEHGCLLSEMPPGQRAMPRFFVGRNRLISGLSLGVLIVEAPKGSGALTTAELALSQNRDVFTVRRADTGSWCEGNRELISAGCEAITDGWELMSRYAPMFPGRVIDGRSREAMQRLYQKRYGSFYAVYSPTVHLESPCEQVNPMPHKIPEAFKKEKKESCAHSSVRQNVKIDPVDSRPKEENLDDLPEAERRILSVMGNSPMEIDVIIMRSGMEPTAVSTALTMLQIKKRIIKCFGNSYQRL